jgi:hypothetical protein
MPLLPLSSLFAEANRRWPFSSAVAVHDGISHQADDFFPNTISVIDFKPIRASQLPNKNL